MDQSRNTGTSARFSITDVVGVVVDAQTYRNLLYLLLAFPLGIAYYVLLVTGFALGIGLSVLFVGLGILLVTVIGLRYIASFERWLANTLLDVEISPSDDIGNGDGGLFDTVKRYLQAPSTWRGLGFVALKFWIGILSFILLVTFLGTALELLLVPLYPEGVFDIQVANWEVARSIETPAQRAVAAPAGAALVFVALHLLNAFARANASIASALLGSAAADTDERIEQSA